MVLVERRELIEVWLQQLLTVLDCTLYEPLDSFIEGSNHLLLVLDKLRIIIRTMRVHVAKKKLLFVSYARIVYNIMQSM
jgi:hypothetical protein